MTNRSTPRKALVVDDDPTIVSLLRVVLTDLGFEVISAPNGEAGLEAASSASLDLVVTDAMMPRMTGPEMVRQLRQRVPAVPILMITASDVRGDGFPVLKKPFDLAQLEVAILAQIGEGGEQRGEDGHRAIRPFPYRPEAERE